jgi:hypothetical protein
MSGSTRIAVYAILIATAIETVRTMATAVPLARDGSMRLATKRTVARRGAAEHRPLRVQQLSAAQ